MISQEQAFAAAGTFLEHAYDHSPVHYTLVLLPAESYEHPVAWVVRFDSQEHLDTGAFEFMPFTRVLIVPKDGSEVHFPPTHLPVATYLDQLASGEWPPTKG